MLTRFRVLAVAGVMTASVVTLGAGTAFAGGTPTPEPTVTVTPVPVRTCAVRPITFAPTTSPIGADAIRGDHPTPPPVINPQARCAPEQFVAQITALGSTVVQNRVIASGPVFGTGSLDLPAQTNTFDRALLPGLFRSVNIPHTGLAFPVINLPLCAVSVNQVGVWRFAGGRGLFRRAIGNGTFLLTGQWVFPTIRGVCTLRFLRGNPILQNRILPRYTNIQVWATGLARR